MTIISLLFSPPPAAMQLHKTDPASRTRSSFTDQIQPHRPDPASQARSSRPDPAWNPAVSKVGHTKCSARVEQLLHIYRSADIETTSQTICWRPPSFSSFHKTRFPVKTSRTGSFMFQLRVDSLGYFCQHPVKLSQLQKVQTSFKAETMLQCGDSGQLSFLEVSESLNTSSPSASAQASFLWRKPESQVWDLILEWDGNTKNSKHLDRCEQLES